MHNLCKIDACMVVCVCVEKNVITSSLGLRWRFRQAYHCC